MSDTDPIKQCAQHPWGHRYQLQSADGTLYWIAASRLRHRNDDRVSFHNAHPSMPVPLDIAEVMRMHNNTARILECKKHAWGHRYLLQSSDGKQFWVAASQMRHRNEDRVAFHRAHADMPLPPDMVVLMEKDN